MGVATVSSAEDSMIAAGDELAFRTEGFVAMSTADDSITLAAGKLEGDTSEVAGEEAIGA
jgi:hypothetical protein